MSFKLPKLQLQYKKEEIETTGLAYPYLYRFFKILHILGTSLVGSVTRIACT